MAKILLVEDDNNLREIYEARLQAEGYTIVSAQDGEQALVVAKAEKPDLVISDVMMPKISGFEMLDILRNTEGLKDVKVIMLTALGQSDDQSRADKLGADRYLVKSQVTLEDIVKVAHDLLEDTSAAPAAASPEPAAPATPTPAPTPVAAPLAPEPAVTPASSAVPPVTPVAATPEPTAAIPVAAPPAQPVDTPIAPPITPQPSSVVSASPPETESTTAPIEPVKPNSSPSGTATTTSTDDPAQSTAQEEAAVDAQIEDFVAGATSEATAPPAEPASSAPADSTSTSDDTLMANAVDTLMANTEDAVPTATDTSAPVVVKPDSSATPPSPAATSDDKTSAAQPNDTGNVHIANKKVIQPLESSPKKDLDTLLALEEAKQSGASTPEKSAGGSENPLDPANIAL